MFYFVHNAEKEVIIAPQEFQGSFIGTQAQLVIQPKFEQIIQYMKENDIKLGFEITPDYVDLYKHFFEVEEVMVEEEREDVTFDDDNNKIKEVVKELVGTSRYIVVNFL